MGFQRPGEVLLVSCYELGRQPLGLASPKAFLEREGFHPAAIDLAVEALDPAKVKGARFVGISVPMHTALRIGVGAARTIRELAPEAHICFYGLYAALHSDWLLESAADSVIGGEYEAALVALVNALDEGTPLAVQGVAVRGRKASPILQRLPFPQPSRGGLPVLSRYAKIEIGGATGLAGAVEASRGCLHLCRHCPIPPVYEGRFFAVPVDIVLADVEALVAAGATHITFADPDFLNGPSHAERVTHELHRRWPHLTYDFTAKIEHLLKHRSLLPAFAANGCAFVVSAVESLSPKVLSILDKGHTRADVDEAIDLVEGAGIALRPSLLPFTPWSSLEDYRDLLEFVIRRDMVDRIDPVQLTIRLLVPPGSLLEKHPEMEPHLGVLDREALTWSWTHPDPRMDRLHHTVTAIVAEAARNGQDPRRTFDALVEKAHEENDPAARRVHAARSRDAISRRPRAPRLTEPWFC